MRDLINKNENYGILYRVFFLRILWVHTKVNLILFLGVHHDVGKVEWELDSRSLQSRGLSVAQYIYHYLYQTTGWRKNGLDSSSSPHIPLQWIEKLQIGKKMMVRFLCSSTACLPSLVLGDTIGTDASFCARPGAWDYTGTYVLLWEPGVIYREHVPYSAASSGVGNSADLRAVSGEGRV